MNKYIPLLLTIFLIFGCNLNIPQQNGQSRPGITLTIDIPAGSRTILPGLDMAIATFDITGSGPNGDSFSILGQTGTTCSRQVTESGAWTITVEGKNAAGKLVGQGTNTVTIPASGFAPITVAVAPLPGTGTLSVSVSWPAGSLASPGVTATLQPKVGSEAPIVFNLAGTSATYSDASAGQGYYILKLTVSNGTNPVYRTIESVRVASGATTSAVFTLTTNDIDNPDTTITIDPAMDDPVTIAFSGQVSTLGPGGSMTVTATPSAAVDSFAWYLNGSLLSGQTAATVTIDASSLTPGVYQLVCVVAKGDAWCSDKITFNVITGHLDIVISYKLKGGPEQPDSGEDIVVSYYNQSGAWVVLRTITAAECSSWTVFSDTLTNAANPAAFHANFKLKFSQSANSGSGYDNYYLDDVVVSQGGSNDLSDDFPSSTLSVTNWSSITGMGTDATYYSSAPYSAIFSGATTREIISANMNTN